MVDAFSVNLDAVQAPTDVAELTGRTFSATVANDLQHSRTVEIHGRIDFGTMVASDFEVGSMVLDAASVSSIEVDLSSYANEIGLMKYSGRISLTAVDSDLGAAVSSAPVFFHPTGADGLVTYGRIALVTDFASGDYQGLHATDAAADSDSDWQGEAAIYPTRIVDATAAPTGDSDNLESEITEGE